MGVESLMSQEPQLGPFFIKKVPKLTLFIRKVKLINITRRKSKLFLALQVRKREHNVFQKTYKKAEECNDNLYYF